MYHTRHTHTDLLLSNLQHTRMQVLVQVLLYICMHNLVVSHVHLYMYMIILLKLPVE